MSEICLGHVTRCCKDCTPNEDNRKCPYYHKVVMQIIEVKNDRDISKPAPMQCVQKD